MASGRQTRIPMPAELPFILFIGLPMLIGWVTLALIFWRDPTLVLCLAPRSRSPSSLGSLLAEGGEGIYVTSLITTGALMAACMGLPLALLSAIRVGAGAFPHMRLQLIGLYCAAWCAIWTLTSAALLFAAELIKVLVGLYVPLVWICLTISLICAFQRFAHGDLISRDACHGMPPLRAFAPGAQIDALSLGMRFGLRCFSLCSATMMIPSFASRPFLAMVIISIISIAERHSILSNRRRMAIVFGCIAIAI